MSAAAIVAESTDPCGRSGCSRIIGEGDGRPVSHLGVVYCGDRCAALANQAAAAEVKSARNSASGSLAWISRRTVNMPFRFPRGGAA